MDSWCDGAWICCFTTPFSNSLGSPIQRCLTTAFWSFFPLMCHEWKVYLLQPQQTKISSNPTHYCKPFSKLMKNKLLFGCMWTFSLEKSILFEARREAIKNSYRLASDHVWEQSELAVMGQAVPKPCVPCLEKEPAQGSFSMLRESWDQPHHTSCLTVF